MKIKFVVASALVFSMGAYAQKDELKAIKKFESKLEKSKEEPTKVEMEEYKALIEAAESKLAFADKAQQAEIYYYKGNYYLDEVGQMMTNPTGASEPFYHMKDSFDRVIEIENSEKGKYTKLIKDEIYARVKALIITLADKLVEVDELTLASDYYYTAYGLDTTDHHKLYMAAAYAVNGKQYQKALDYYVELDKTGWTGEGKSYSAINKATNVEEYFPNQDSRDVAVSTGKYFKPDIKEFKSVKPEIVRNIAMLYNELGQADKAKQALANARKLNPDDVDLITIEANLYLDSGDNEGAKKLINEAVAKQPKNPNLYLALGALSVEKDPKQTEMYYKKAIEVQPDFFEGYARLGDLMLMDEQKLTDQMNALGNTPADNKKYAELKKQKEINYRSALAYYEKAYSLKKDDQYVIGLLANLYQALEMDAKYQEFKAKKQ